jgi:hypothetical protein
MNRIDPEEGGLSISGFSGEAGSILEDIGTLFWGTALRRVS